MTSLKSAYCQKYDCSPDQFEEKVFRKCLYPQARLVASFIRLFSHRFFFYDFELLNSVGEASTLSEIVADIGAFRCNPRWQGGVLRRTLRIRISGKRLIALAKGLLKEESQRAPYPTMKQK